MYLLGDSDGQQNPGRRNARDLSLEEAGERDSEHFDFVGR